VKAVRILFTVVVIGVLALAARPLGAAAQSSSIGTDTPTPPIPAYDIEAYDYYCPGGITGCPGVATGQNYANLYFGDAEFYGPRNNSISGTPEEVYVECTQYLPGPDADYRDITLVVTTDVTYQDPAYNYADSGIITGQATLLRSPNGNTGSEDNPAQGSTGHVSIFDTSTANGEYGAHATISGVQNTDNADDQQNSGGFTISVTGYIDTFKLHGPQPAPYWGTMTCHAGGPDILTLTDWTYYFEGEMESTFVD